MYETIAVTRLTEKQRKGFSCGVLALDDYFKQYAKNNHIKNIGKTFALVDNNDNSVIGYYTTTMGNIDFKVLPREISSKIPKYPVPIVRIARLAVDSNKQGIGWGKYLLIDCFQRILNAIELVAAFGIVVDAKDNNAKNFYKRYGFIELLDHPLNLFLPVSLIKKIL